MAQYVECPDCGEEMEEGVLQCAQTLLWAEKKHLISLAPRDGEVVLGRNIMHYCTIPAWICKDCKKVVLDYSTTEVTEFFSL